MAKIQYIKPSSSTIEFETSGSSYDYSSRSNQPKRTDPALRVILAFGIGGFVIAVLALFLTIIAVQSRKDSNTVLAESFANRISNAQTLLSKSLEGLAIEKFRTATTALMNEYKAGKIGHRSMLRFTDAMWQDIIQSEHTRGLLIAILQANETITGVVPAEVTAALDYFRNAKDEDVIIGARTASGAAESEPLFPVIQDDFSGGGGGGGNSELPPYMR